ncbi:hypothetical protein [Pseudoxanthomonas wuyuanensis]|uniref:TolB amino-terminal domain-containing protein n=1 Tax=Pseudoxanthomonas wuyuanensis TaxID=1073196 RepID=A0A286DGB4_9GAMM|nr:hypothetical protein [Pseudoxanthomonas wuyuanensis]KAF1719684.1 hypothetical protein CSC75_14380 [Pseudoxanthomonas wuyuanensis]SOD57630.1 hypothetical protein SAMN06296416_11514 [Pseudoxanthomonas wuyuanensis]
MASFTQSSDAPDSRPQLSDASLSTRAEAMAALQRVLSSPLFSRSPSMSRLLRYVVENGMAGNGNRITQYSIGLEALGKKPDGYNPGDDPTVRVQMGRLREKLRRYYDSGQARAGEPRLEIPSGSYVPVLHPSSSPEGAGAGGHARKLLLSRFQPIGLDGIAAAMAQGMREELLHRLFCRLPDGMELVPAACPAAPADIRLEGSLRQGTGEVRATLRLIEQASGRLMRSRQFDGACTGALCAQEAMAESICAWLLPVLRALTENPDPQAG